MLKLMASHKIINIDLYLLPSTKLNSKWIKDLISRADMLNLTEGKVGFMPELIGVQHDYSNSYQGININN